MTPAEQAFLQSLQDNLAQPSPFARVGLDPCRVPTSEAVSHHVEIAIEALHNYFSTRPDLADLIQQLRDAEADALKEIQKAAPPFPGNMTPPPMPASPQWTPPPPGLRLWDLARWPTVGWGVMIGAALLVLFWAGGRGAPGGRPPEPPSPPSLVPDTPVKRSEATLYTLIGTVWSMGSHLATRASEDYTTGGNPNLLLQRYAHRGNVPGLRELLQRGADPNYSDADGSGTTALMMAVAGGNREAVRVLLEQPGIEVNRPNQEGQTALHLAVKKDQPEIVKLLLQKQADPNIRDKKLQSALNLSLSETVRNLIVAHGGVD